jgi:hypothetical protein
MILKEDRLISKADEYRRSAAIEQMEFRLRLVANAVLAATQFFQFDEQALRSFQTSTAVLLRNVEDAKTRIRTLLSAEAPAAVKEQKVRKQSLKLSDVSERRSRLSTRCSRKLSTRSETTSQSAADGGTTIIAVR